MEYVAYWTQAYNGPTFSPPLPFFGTSQGQRCFRESTTVRGTHSKHYDLYCRKQQSQPVTFKNTTTDLFTSAPVRYLASKPNFLLGQLYLSPEGFGVQSLEQTDSHTDKPVHINMHLIRYSSHQQLIHCLHMR